MPTHENMARVVVVMTIGLVAISFASILIKLCQAPSLVIASYRLILASLFYQALAMSRRAIAWKTITARQWLLAIGSGLFLSLHFCTWITSLQYTSVASSVVLVQTAPVLVAVGSHFFLKEKATRVLMAGIALSLLGGAIIGYYDFQGAQSSLHGNLLAFMGAVGAAGYLLIGRKLRAQWDTIMYVSIVYSVSALSTLLITFGSGQPLQPYPATTWMLFILIAFFPQVIGHTTLNWALKHFSATTVSIMTLAEPIGASILAFLVLHEQVGWIRMLGGTVILSGILLTLLAEKKSEERHEQK
jgi:drug/metabolite transporter (DMT)-like permease